MSKGGKPTPYYEPTMTDRVFACFRRESLTTDEIRLRITDLTRDNADQVLSRLCARGLIERVGPAEYRKPRARAING